MGLLIKTNYFDVIAQKRYAFHATCMKNCAAFVMMLMIKMKVLRPEDLLC